MANIVEEGLTWKNRLSAIGGFFIGGIVTIVGLIIMFINLITGLVFLGIGVIIIFFSYVGLKNAKKIARRQTTHQR